MGVADLAYLFTHCNVKTDNVRVAQSWHLSMMYLMGLRPGSMQSTCVCVCGGLSYCRHCCLLADSNKNYTRKAMRNRKRRSTGEAAEGRRFDGEEMRLSDTETTLLLQHPQQTDPSAGEIERLTPL